MQSKLRFLWPAPLHPRMTGLEPIGPAWLASLHATAHYDRHFNKVPVDDNGNYDFGSNQYYESLGIEAGMGVIVGAIFTLSLFIFLCFRLCFDARRRPKPSRHPILVVIFLLLMGANIFIVLSGRNLATKVIDDGRAMYGAYEDARFSIAHASNDFAPNAPDELIQQLKGIPDSDAQVQNVQDEQAAVRQYLAACATITSDLPNLDLGRGLDIAATALHWAAIGVCIAFGVVGVYALLLIGTPNACVRVLSYMLGFLLMLFAAGAMGVSFGALTGLADGCHNTTGIILELQSQSYVPYYLTCQGSFPFEPEFDAARQFVDAAAGKMAAVQAFLRSKGASTATADLIASNLQNANRTITHVYTTTQCSGVQASYADALDVACNNVPPYGLCLVIFTGLLTVMLFASIFVVAVLNGGKRSRFRIQSDEATPLLQQPVGSINDSVPDATCKICLANPITTINRPCSHVLCTECSKKLPQCPFCRQPVTERLPVFL
eukprot:m.236516 g.236516  ORF g.236516 m.236516 type:complete len:492 (+) comp12982_c0_seq1:1-1476(+)